ncbi:MAG: hypothetical protein U0Q55_10130 [Vicinamibacterales bacterium]
MPPPAASQLRATISRLAVYVHRWLGIGLGFLFITWFVSGVVLMYVGMPSLSNAERLAHTPPLDFSTAVVPVSAAAASAGTRPTAVTLGMRLGRPVYRLRAGARTVSVFADDGGVVPAVTAGEAVAVATRYADGRTTGRYDGYLDSPDQWTLEINRQLPMHRITLDDAADTTIYVSATTGDAVLKTTAASRWWAYPGAILHWIYFTPIRRHTAGWAQLIIWTSVAGTVMSLVGLAWGAWRFSPRAAYRLRREPSRSPYAGWMWWHHYTGLFFGVVTTTWIFSGLLSMDPWDWHPGTQPTQVQRDAFAGGPFDVAGITAAQVQAALHSLGSVREATVIQSQGTPFLATDRGVASLDDDAAAHLPLEASRVRSLAASAMPDAALAAVTRLDRYDAYYYDRDGALALPVWRIEFSDPARTWLYVDPARGLVVRKEERLSRLNRWLYHGLHSLDFPVLYYRRPLWDVVVIALSLGGLSLVLTPVVPALRRLARHARRG